MKATIATEATTAFSINYRRNIVPDESLAIDHLLSRELLKLSLTDRTAIQEEIHGVRCLAVGETPELIHMALKEFYRELDKIPKEEKRTYDECRVRAILYQDEKETCYAFDDAFYLRFLRVELFDAAKAVRRFVSYLEFVREFWGTEIALKRLIRLSDFSKAEMKLFRKGYFQVFPFRDHSGRRVLTLLGGFAPGIDPVARTKALFYIADVLTRNDIESQQRGVVVITESYCWSAEDSGHDNRSTNVLKFPHPHEGLHYVKKIFDAVPVRLIAVHNCWPDRPAFRIISKLLTIHGVSGSTQRLRLKFHIGDELEMRYRLKTYGIPIELMPITETGSIKMVNHNYWIKTRRLVEQGIDMNAIIIECPGTNDVVFRQGTSSMENPGNVKFRDMILSLLDNRDVEMSMQGFENNTNSFAAKYHTKIADRVLDQIDLRHHGRFLEWDKHRGAWVQMTNRQKIKQKVSVLLLSINKRYRRPVHANTGVNSVIVSTKRGANSNDSVASANIVSSSSSSSRKSSHSSSTCRPLQRRHSPSLILQQNLEVMAIQSDVEEEAGWQKYGVTGKESLGPYSFLQGGENVFQQDSCCQPGKDVFPLPQKGRKRMKKSIIPEETCSR